MESNIITMSSMPKTWIFDIDGTILKHNGHLTSEKDSILQGVSDFFTNYVKKDDYVLLLTAREEKYKSITIEFLKKNNIRFDNIIFNIPSGERIVFNDTKPKGMKTALAVPLKRDKGLSDLKIEIDKLI